LHPTKTDSPAANGAAAATRTPQEVFSWAFASFSHRRLVVPPKAGYLVTLGKIIGGGLPIGAVAGPARWLDLLAPLGPVYQGGTFAGNPVVMATGLAALAGLRPATYRSLERAGARLEAGLRDALATHAVPGCVQRVGSMLTLFFGIDRAESMEDVRRADAARFGRFFHAMLERGVHLPPSAYEAWFLSTAHTRSVIDRTIEAATESIATLR
jgi:glutamate-1-semialdehyde 2,1-aminomutase